MADSKSEKEEIETFLERLTDKYEYLRGKMEVLKFIDNPPTENDRKTINDFNVFFIMIRSALITDIIINLHNVYQHGDGYGLPKFLNKVSSNWPLFDAKNEKRLREIAEGDKKGLDVVEEILEKVRTIRNKDRAHYDKIYFLNPELLQKDAPLSMEELDKLMIPYQQIIWNYRLLLLGRDYSPGIPELLTQIRFLVERLQVYEEMVKDRSSYEVLDKMLAIIRQRQPEA